MTSNQGNQTSRSGATPTSDNEERAQARKKYDQISINGADLAYRDFGGDGEPMILVHANISDIRSWDPTAEKLVSQGFRVIIYSRRYAWPNAPIPDGIGDPWVKHADDLEALIKKIDVGPVNAVGNSNGAHIILLAVRRAPELFRSMILEEPPAISVFLPTTAPAILDVLKLLIWHPLCFLPLLTFFAGTIRPTAIGFQAGDDEKALQTFVRGVVGGEESYARISETRWRQMRENVAPHGALFKDADFGTAMSPVTEREARGIKVPTLMITGQKTCSAHRCINWKLANVIPGAKEVVVKGASHLVHEDRPDEVVKAIKEFVEGLKKRLGFF